MERRTQARVRTQAAREPGQWRGAAVSFRQRRGSRQGVMERSGCWLGRAAARLALVEAVGDCSRGGLVDDAQDCAQGGERRKRDLSAKCCGGIVPVGLSQRDAARGHAAFSRAVEARDGTSVLGRLPLGVVEVCCGHETDRAGQPRQCRMFPVPASAAGLNEPVRS